jgi:hypothetical protein
MEHSVRCGTINRFGKGNALVGLVCRDERWGVDVLVVDKDPNARMAHLTNGARRRYFIKRPE